jgi:hypothetical protein
MTLPNTPVAGTGLTVPLVTADQYIVLTGDSTSNADDVQDAITDAVRDIAAECRRSLVYGQYQEVLYLYKKGMVFPSATPIDRTQSILASGQSIYNPATDNNKTGSLIQGAGVWVGWFTPLPWMPVWQGVLDPQTPIDYWGGFQPYQSTGGSTDSLPPKLAKAICTVAYYQLHPVALAGLPGGVKSMSVGGVSISGDLSSFMASDPTLRRTIKRFRHPQVHAWES